MTIHYDIEMMLISYSKLYDKKNASPVETILDKFLTYQESKQNILILNVSNVLKYSSLTKLLFYYFYFPMYL